LIGRVAILPMAGALLAGATLAQTTEKLAPYYPTPEKIVEQMLKLGELKPGEKMFDLGSGDGRIVIMAAKKFQADATGVEFDDDLWKQSADRIRHLGDAILEVLEERLGARAPSRGRES